MEATLEERFAELDVKEKSTEECIREEKQRIRVSVWKTLEEQKNIREYPPLRVLEEYQITKVRIMLQIKL